MNGKNAEQSKKMAAYEAGDVSWYEDEFLDLQLGDKRLNKRLEEIIRLRMSSPNNSIPQSMGSWEKTKGAYRFFANSKSDPKLIIESHSKSTERRLIGKKIILAPQDTTDFTYSSLKETEGLGYINDLENLKGYFYHPTLAITTDGVPLGILNHQVWVREEINQDMSRKEKLVARRKISIERLVKILAIDSIIAWRILFLTTIGRECPDLPASILFEEYEWKALHAAIHNTKDVPNEVPKLSVVIKQIGQQRRPSRSKVRLCIQESSHFQEVSTNSIPSQSFGNSLLVGKKMS